MWAGSSFSAVKQGQDLSFYFLLCVAAALLDVPWRYKPEHLDIRLCFHLDVLGFPGLWYLLAEYVVKWGSDS